MPRCSPSIRGECTALGAFPDRVLDVYDRAIKATKRRSRSNHRKQRTDPCAVTGGEYAEIAEPRRATRSSIAAVRLRLAHPSALRINRT